jgi:kumamolisin
MPTKAKSRPKATPPEQRVELEGSGRKPLEGARRVADASPKERLTVSVLLRRGSEPGAFPDLHELGSTPPNERKHLTRKQFEARHGAKKADIAKVRAFAKRYGLQVASASPGRRTVVLKGTVQAFNRAFGVKLATYKHPEGTYRGREGTLTLPAELAPVVEGVFGLDNRPQAKPHFRIRVNKKHVHPQAASVSYTALQVAQGYDFPAGTDGTGQTIAIIELGGGYKTADLTKYFKGLGIATPEVTAVSVDDASNAPTGDANGPDGEVDLDIEVAGAVAPGAQLGVYFAPNTDQGFIDAVTTAVHDTKLNPSIVSISWGGPESSWTQQARDGLNSACQDAATMGVTVLVASGDNGADDGTSSPTVDFPAASPYVIGCGGTKLELSGGAISSEVVWNELASGEGATGGGISETFAIPTYQQSANVPAAPNGFAGRGVPDVAGDADPTTGYSVVVDGSATVIGGTSAVAPLWSGLLARINQSLGKSVGYLNPLLYGASAAATLHEITSGSNGGYNAGPGWNPCTGLGTPDGAALLAALGGKPAAMKARRGARGRR